MYSPGSSLTVDNAAAVLSDGARAITSGQYKIDLSGLTALDSSAVAVLLAWQRAAFRQSLTLNFVNSPSSLRTLAELYGVDALLQLA